MDDPVPRRVGDGLLKRGADAGGAAGEAPVVGRDDGVQREPRLLHAMRAAAGRAYCAASPGGGICSGGRRAAYLHLPRDNSADTAAPGAGEPERLRAQSAAAEQQAARTEPDRSADADREPA